MVRRRRWHRKLLLATEGVPKLPVFRLKEPDSEGDGDVSERAAGFSFGPLALRLQEAQELNSLSRLPDNLMM